MKYHDKKYDDQKILSNSLKFHTRIPFSTLHIIEQYRMQITLLNTKDGFSLP